MSVEAISPTLAKVLSSLPLEQLKILNDHAQVHAFHRGRQWFGTGMRVEVDEYGLASNDSALGFEQVAPCPVAAAFHVNYDSSPSGWFSARIDENLMAAIRHIVDAAGAQEDGMEQYLKELENTDPISLHNFVVTAYKTVARASEQ